MIALAPPRFVLTGLTIFCHIQDELSRTSPRSHCPENPGPESQYTGLGN